MANDYSSFFYSLMNVKRLNDLKTVCSQINSIINDYRIPSEVYNSTSNMIKIVTNKTMKCFPWNSFQCTMACQLKHKRT